MWTRLLKNNPLTFVAWILAIVLVQLFLVGVLVRIMSRVMIELSIPLTDARAYSLMVTILVGAALGLLQWLILRRQLSSVGWWPLAAVLGSMGIWLWSLIPYIGPPAPSYFGEAILALIYGSMYGLTYSAAQWFVLRKAGLRSRGWPFANAIAWAVSSVLGVFGLGGPGGILGLTILGAITGLEILRVIATANTDGLTLDAATD